MTNKSNEKSVPTEHERLEADAAKTILAQQTKREHESHFFDRGKKTSLGDRKNKSGRKTEHAEALADQASRTDEQIHFTTAAQDAGVITEE